MLTRPATSFFILAFAISWLGAFLAHPTTRMDGLMLFPIMLLGPSLAAVLLTARAEGKIGVRHLFQRIFRARAGIKEWSIILLLPPIMVLLTLNILSRLISPVYAPNHFYIGFLFGILAGIMEEIGWTGFALPALRKKYSLLTSGLILGLCWGIWHLPVIDFLGAAYPHGSWLPYFFLSFILLMTAMRVLMVRIYAATGSGLPIVVMHANSTGCLAALGPFHVTPCQEAFWYLVYGIGLWIVVPLITHSRDHPPDSPQNRR